MRIKTDYPATSKDAVNLEYIQRIYPVGSLYISTLSTNPSDLFGFGTWEAWGKGRAIVGLDPDDADWDTAEETRGEKTHTLTAAQSGLPAHTHQQTVQDGQALYKQSSPAGSSSYISATGTNVNTANPLITASNSTANASEAHNNIQPSIVAYLWKRTA